MTWTKRKMAKTRGCLYRELYDMPWQDQVRLAESTYNACFLKGPISQKALGVMMGRSQAWVSTALRLAVDLDDPKIKRCKTMAEAKALLVSRGVKANTKVDTQVATVGRKMRTWL